MGVKAKEVRDRTCWSCERVLYVNAHDLKRHAVDCVRASRLGLKLPRVERPKFEIIRP